MAEDKMTPAEAAELLGVSVRTLDNKARAGLVTKHIAPIGIGRGGRRVYYLREEIESLKAQMVDANPAKTARKKRASNR